MRSGNNDIWIGDGAAAAIVVGSIAASEEWGSDSVVVSTGNSL